MTFDFDEWEIRRTGPDLTLTLVNRHIPLDVSPAPQDGTFASCGPEVQVAEMSRLKPAKFSLADAEWVATRQACEPRDRRTCRDGSCISYR
jgi:hypothetical protein